MSDAVFLSYASQDAEPARKICDALRQAGVEVWFDQSELRGGDSWDQKIRKQIKECALFVPIISRNTQARPEGYFRLEWHLAEQRSHLIARGRPFIVPVSVDDTHDEEALVPDAFLAVQWMRVPRGDVDRTFCERMRVLLGGTDRLEAGRPRPAQRDETVPARTKTTRGLRWLKPVLASAAVVVIVLTITLIRRPNRRPSEPSATEPAVEKLSPARELAHRAEVIVKRGSLTRAQLDAAEELCDRALQLDTTDAVVWVAAAHVEISYIYPYGSDVSDERRRRAQERVGRAASLSPDLFEVRVAQAQLFAHAVATPALMAEAEKTFRQLLVERPGNRDLIFQLAEVLRGESRFEDAARLFESIDEFELAGWSYCLGGKPRLGLAAVARAPKTATALELKAILEFRGNEDLTAAQSAIDQMQPSDLLSEMPTAVAIEVALYRRDPERMLEIAKGLGRDYLDSNAFRGPLGYFTGLAQVMAGRPALAAAEWRTALATVQTRLKDAPDNRELLMWSAWLHAALGDTAEAEKILARGQALAGLTGDTVDLSNYRVLLELRKKDAFLAGAEDLLREKYLGGGFHADMRFSPEYDFLRGDPRFEKLLHDYSLPGAALSADRPPKL